MRFIIRYSMESTGESQKNGKWQKTLIGIDVLDQLEKKDQSLYIHLIEEPLLILEQLLMYCKFESLYRILGMQIDVPVESFDKIVRFYAGKSLDFRVALHREAEGKLKDNSSSSTQGEEFFMPPNAPIKEEWVPNDKVRSPDHCFSKSSSFIENFISRPKNAVAAKSSFSPCSTDATTVVDVAESFAPFVLSTGCGFPVIPIRSWCEFATIVRSKLRCSSRPLLWQAATSWNFGD